MFKIQLADGFYQNKSGRIQHFSTKAKADAKIEKLGEIATGAIIVECKDKTVASKTENPEETATVTKVVKVNKAKTASAKLEKPIETASVKGKKKSKKSVTDD